MVNFVPSLYLLSKLIVPPSSSINFYYNSQPWPFALVVNNGVKSFLGFLLSFLASVFNNNFYRIILICYSNSSTVWHCLCALVIKFASCMYIESVITLVFGSTKLNVVMFLEYQLLKAHFLQLLLDQFLQVLVLFS